MSSGFTNPFDIFNYVSPSAWVAETIETVTGFDVFGAVTQLLTGDWEAIWKFGDAMGNLAQCMQQIGINIQAGMLQLDPSWDGNASDAAFRYFTGLAAATSGQQAALYAAKDGYHNAARGAWQLASQLGNLLQAIGDKAIVMGISAALGTATAETVAGAVVGWDVAALLAADILKLANNISTIINTAGTVILGAFGTGMVFADQGGDLSAVQLPSAAYMSPGA